MGSCVVHAAFHRSRCALRRRAAPSRGRVQSGAMLPYDRRRWSLIKFEAVAAAPTEPSSLRRPRRGRGDDRLPDPLLVGDEAGELGGRHQAAAHRSGCCSVLSQLASTRACPFLWKRDMLWKSLSGARSFEWTCQRSRHYFCEPFGGAPSPSTAAGSFSEQGRFRSLGKTSRAIACQATSGH